MANRGANGFDSFDDEVGEKGPVDHKSRSGGDRPPQVKKPLTLSVDDLAPNPRNPRDSIGDLDDLRSIVEDQVQPIAVIRAEAYRTVYPGDVIDRPYVVICGNRRLAAALKFGRLELDVFVRDDWATSHGELLKRIMAENTDRAGFNVIEEARVVEQMVHEFGGQEAAGKQLSKTKGWVSQRLALLRLALEIQNALRVGDLAVTVAREWGSMPEAEQLELWSAHQKEQLRKRRRVEHRDRNRGSGPSESDDTDPASDELPRPMRSVTKALRQATHKDAGDAAQALRDFLGEGTANRLRIDLGKCLR
ncbi:MAG: ParB/RepB/Spo0J family partition protein [Actinomycetia bacterium]|nr:ParB/RepB/Spo0J family partition protein [Actinomycetes bacterium]